MIGSCVTIFGSVPDIGGYGSQSETVFQPLEPRFFHVLVDLGLTDVLAFFDVVDI
jgi:hypothetical protein